MEQTMIKTFRLNMKSKTPGDDNVIVSYKDKDLCISYPFYGPSNPSGLLNAIESDNERLVGSASQRRIKQATTEEAISLVHPTYGLSFSEKNENKLAHEITRILSEGYLTTAIGILYHPDTKLAYFVPYPKFNHESIVDTPDLIKRVESKEEIFKTVGFSEIEKKKLLFSDLRKHPYVVEWAGGIEYAGKLEDIASRTPSKKADLYVPDVSELKQPNGRISALNSNMYYHRSLEISGNSDGYDIHGWVGYAFGVVQNF